MSRLISSEFCKASIELLDQSMIKVVHCVEQLKADQIWWRPVSGMNSVGNLCVHLAGNLRQWGIVPFTDESDRRQREGEFSNKLRSPASELLTVLDVAVAEAKTIWKELDQDQLLAKKNIQGFDVSAMHAISHTSSHFVGHAHQMISLTRMQLGADYRFQWSPEKDRGDLPI